MVYVAARDSFFEGFAGTKILSAISIAWLPLILIMLIPEWERAVAIAAIVSLYIINPPVMVR